MYKLEVCCSIYIDGKFYADTFFETEIPFIPTKGCALAIGKLSLVLDDVISSLAYFCNEKKFKYQYKESYFTVGEAEVLINNLLEMGATVNYEN